jgi:hypothetical protein
VRQQRASGITSLVTDTVEQFGIAYDIHSWLRYLTWLAIASAAYLLLRVSGGFPPPAWYLLLRTAPQIPHLFSMRGAAILFPLLGLVALSLTWLALWCMLLWAGLAAVGHWWYSTSSQQAQRRQKTAANAWQRSRPLSGNSNAKRVSNLAEAVLDPFEYAETNVQSKTGTGRCKHPPPRVLDQHGAMQASPPLVLSSPAPTRVERSVRISISVMWLARL